MDEQQRTRPGRKSTPQRIQDYVADKVLVPEHGFVAKGQLTDEHRLLIFESRLMAQSFEVRDGEAVVSSHRRMRAAFRKATKGREVVAVRGGGWERRISDGEWLT